MHERANMGDMYLEQAREYDIAMQQQQEREEARVMMEEQIQQQNLLVEAARKEEMLREQQSALALQKQMQEQKLLTEVAMQEQSHEESQEQSQEREQIDSLLAALEALLKVEDAENAAGEVEGTPVTLTLNEGSCGQLCGKKIASEHGFCFCDATCYRNNDCCTDHFGLCVSQRLKTLAWEVLFSPPAPGTIAGWKLWQKLISLPT
jgi:hypothetical protein